MKKLLTNLAVFCLLLAIFAAKVEAKIKVSLSQLPEYQNTTSPRFYYTYLQTQNNQAFVNLFVQKEGHDFRQTIDKNKTSTAGFFDIQGADI